MLKKKSIFILLPLTIIVWVLISYKIFISLGSGDNQMKKNPSTNNIQTNEVILDESFSLLLDYPDPFLKQISANKNEFKQDFNNRKNKVLNLESVWPSIKYFGLIKNKKTNELKISIQFEMKNFILSVRDEVDGVSISEIHSDSIIVSKNRIRKTIYKYLI